MNDLVMLVPIALPVLFWAGYHYHVDRHLPEPAANLALCFCLGIAAAFASAGAYRLLGTVGLRLDAVALADGNLPGLFAYAVLAIGPIEELSKLLPFLLIALRFRAFDDDLDGIVYASFIGLGYAAAENLHYLEYLTPLEAAARGFAGPVVHIAFASVWGYLIGHAFLAGQAVGRAAVAGFLLSAILHGVYDFFALAAPAFSLLYAAVIVAGLWVWRLLLIRRLTPETPASDSLR